jgi:capsular polysaccharide biosynthesis protein
MADNKTCPHCGKPVSPTALGELCPECMLKAGLATQTEGPGAAGEAAGPRFIPPPVGEIAKLFPQLEILRLIGQGGMGAVYKARQPSLDRFIALKVLPAAAAGDPGFAERFNREARALARLNHPNIVAVHDFGRAGTLHYLVMEFVDGANLREVERLGELTPEQALAIVPQICEALQFAHNEGIVHRDIKPENLLLDKRGRVKITDFGIAKMVGVGTGHQNLTGAKDVVGTPHYMAPEQIEKPLSVDHRADIYSLGVVFYEMLTGELPLGKFQPPSKKVQIDVRLDEVVLHALEKEPDRRYQQASQVKTAVETIAARSPGDNPADRNRPVPTAVQIEAARQRLKIPARGLIAAGVLQILFALGLLVFAMPAIAREGGGLAGYAVVGFGAALLMTIAAIVFLGASSMMELRRYTFSMVMSVVAAVAGPGALLGLPFGVWAVLVLNQREVRAAFAAENRRPHKTTPTSDTDRDRLTPARIAFHRGALVWLGTFLLILMAASFITFLLPRAYVGDARVKIISAPPLQDYNPYLVQNEIQFIQSTVVPQAADALNLAEQWGKKYANGRTLTRAETYSLLERSVEIEPIRNTILIDVRFYSQSPTEAAEIANKIAEIYCTLPPGHRGDIVRLAEPSSRPIRPNVPLNIFIGVVAGGVFGIFAGTWVGLISFWRMRTASPPSVQKPDRFWRNFGVAVAAVLFALISIPILIVLVAMFLPAFNAARHGIDMVKDGNVATQNAETNFSIGRAWFPQGDSITITSLERTPDRMVVKGHYDLVSRDQASLALYITTATNVVVPEDSTQTKEISKGGGEFELIHSHLVPGLPHVSMYANGHPFASLYFGTSHEAAAESKAGWITNNTHAPQFSERFAAVIRHESNAPASSLQFRLVLPDNSTAPADWLPSASSSNQIRLSRQVLLDDTTISRAGVDFDPNFGGRMIKIRFTDAGAKHFEAITATNIGHQLAIVFRGRVLSAPVIRSVIPGGECQVTGITNASEVHEIVDYLNRASAPMAEAWSYSPLHERILPLKPFPSAWCGWLGLDSGMILTNSSVDWMARAGYDWIRTNSLDVAASESSKHIPLLIGFDMIIAPAPTNGWDFMTPADVANNWTLWQAEPRQEQVFGAVPGQADTFIFQTREGGKGILQILGFSDNPPGVKIRYKLVQAGNSSEAIDSTTGLAAGQQNVRIDSNTGLSLTTAASDDSKNTVIAAGKWLTLIDRGNYSESWNEASAIFQGGVTEAAWENSMNTFRKPLGDLVSRHLKSAQEMTELPGAPDGHYVLLQFETVFANKKSTIETVTFMLEKDGNWKVAGYYIK